MVLTQDETDILEEELDEVWTYIGASVQSQNIFYVLKAINDEIKASGLDEWYDLNEKGRRLQALYERLYAENRKDLE